MPVRATSTRPTSRISSTNLSILSVPPVTSNTKLEIVASTTRGAVDLGEAQRLDPVIAGARDLDQRQLALDMRADRGQIGDLVHRHQPLELGDDLLDHARRAAEVTMVIRLTALSSVMSATVRLSIL